MAEGGGRRKMANKKQDTPKLASSPADLGLQDKKQTKKSKGHNKSKLEKLKEVVIRILKKHPDGVLKKDIWSLVQKETGLIVSSKEYGLSKMSRAFEKWSDVIRISGSPQAEMLVLKDEEGFRGKPATLDDDDFPALGRHNFEPKDDLTTHMFSKKLSIVKEAEETKNIPSVTDHFPSTVSSHKEANSGSLDLEPFHTTGLRQTEIHQIDSGDRVDDDKSANDFKAESNSNKEVEQEIEADEELEDEEIHAVIDKLLEERKINENQNQNAQPQRLMQSWMHIAEHPTLNTSRQNLPMSDTAQSPERREQGLVQDQFRSLTPLVEQSQVPAGQGLTQAPNRAGQPVVPVQPAIQPGMPGPSFNNVGFPPQGLNRFVIPPQGMNPLGMFLPNLNQLGMSLMGMPLSYGSMPMPGFIPLGIPAAAQHVRPPSGFMNQNNSPMADAKNEVPDMNRGVVSPSAEITDEALSVVSTSDSNDLSETKVSSPDIMSDGDSRQKRKLSQDSGANEIPTSEADNCGMSTINKTQFSKQMPRTNEAGEPLFRTMTTQVSSDIIKPVPAWTQTGVQGPKMMRVQMTSTSDSDIIKPAPAWTQTGIQDPKMAQVQMPLILSSPVTNPKQNQSEVKMPIPPFNQAVQRPYIFLEQNQPPGFRHFENQNLTHSPVLSQIRHQGSAINQTQLSSSISNHVEMQTLETAAQRKGIPSWTRIGKQTSDIKQVKTPLFETSDLNIGRAVAPPMLASQFKMSTPEKESSSYQSVDLSQYDTPQLQQFLNNQEKHFQSQKVPDAIRQPVINAFSRSDLDSWQPFAEDIKCISVKPISKDEFETAVLDIRPVYVPLGKNPTKEQRDYVAKECIELLADANEFVSQERVEKIVLKRFGCNRIQDLGVNYVDQIPCVNELNRLVCKINAYIIAFLKTRSICTLYELKEALREFIPGKEDFSSLKTGPLQRFPVVFQQFRFPPDLAEIPEITTMDILDHFNNFLTQNRLWVNSKLELEAFMNYLVQEYSADNAYMLGVRIRSLPLAITVLKKAKRDSASCHRAIRDHFEENLKTDIGDAFRKFRANILYTGDSAGMEVRKHYLKMKPEFVIREIFDKFSILLLVTQDRRLTKPTKFRRVIEDFLTVMEADELGRNILHLAICMSSTAVEETVREMYATPSDADSTGDQEKHLSHKPPPRKDALIESLKTYLERCLNVGAISLAHLDRIEEKMLEDFGYADFSMIGYGRFLEFLLREAKHILEESGGLLLGSASGGTESDSSFKPQQTDLVEFIRQCMQQENIKPEQIEEILCTHYNVKDVRQLGHGNISRLLSHAEKHGRHMMESYTVFYEPSLLQASRFSQTSNSKVGILGHQTREAAKTCLHNCPLLENMADWSHWNLVFEPEHGKLKDFVQKYGGVTTKTLEGRVVTFDILALEIKPGELLKIVSATSQEDIAKAINSRDIQSTTGHLVSMAVAYKGVENMPLALISRLVTTTLIQMHATEPSRDSTGFPMVNHAAALFVLQCLLRIPTKICVTLANQIFLEPLGHIVGSSNSKQLLVQLCETEKELNHLIELGCLLGIQEWTDVMVRNCQLEDSAVQILPSEVQELFEEDEHIEEAEDMEEDSDSENIDEILGDDVGNAEEREVLDECITAEDTEKDEIISKDTHDKETVIEENHDQARTAITSEKSESSTCEDIVNEIRRDEFGVGVLLSEDGIRLMKVQQERLGRSLDRLSKDLYSKDTHFVLELVQNADDNSYHDNLLNNTTDECPSVKFVIEHDGIYVYNNESGFREKDIRALCDVGRSTKGKHKFGYIGQKGIGFKSVFRITDTPEVHSNGYHIKFDVNSGPMGYIMPHWVPELDRKSQSGWMTQIILRLKPDMRLQTRTLAARFNDIHPSLLLFLHRLREITIENKVENGIQSMRRRDIGENVVEIQHTHGCDRWLVIKKALDASKISLQTKSGADVESTEIALAFPLKQQGKKTIVNRMPPKQPVFAFLPLRSYGFRFIVQGDFDVPSSREDVDRDSPWNQWLRNEIHTVFIESLDTFKAHPDFNSMEAVCAFLQFVPMEDEVLEFFKPVASDILKKLKAKECVPTQPDSEGVIRWKMPSQTVRVRDPLVRSVITPDLLQSHLSLYYLHNDVACMLNSSLTSCLGIETLTSEHLFQLGKALILKMGTHCSNAEDVILISKWMACLYRSLDEFHKDDSILEMLKTHRMLPLTDGELVSLKDKAVFYPIQNSSNDKKRGRDPLYFLQKDVKSLHEMLLKTDDDEVNSQVHKLFLRLGIKQLSPFELINQHIIPVLKTDTWKEKSQETLISYVIYIKEQVEKQASVCNLEEVKEVVMLMTNKGFQNPSKEPMHFPPQYGNQIRLQEVFSGYEWTILDTCYLPQSYTKHVILTWQDFFRKLGVEDFLSFRKRNEHISRNELGESLWCRQSLSWPKDEEEFIVQDYYSVELEGLVTKNLSSEESFASQMSHLFAYLDKYWDSRFSKFCKCKVLNKDGTALLETDSSFSIILRTSSWIPAVVTTTQYSNGSVKRDHNIVLKESYDDVYIKSDVVQNLLFDKVPYLNAKISGGSFCQFLGIKHSVETKTVKELLLKWSERADENVPAEFCTTLEHMKHVYQYLGAWLTRQEFRSLLQEQPVFFVPDRKAVNVINARDFTMPGKMLNKKEIWLVDKSGLFDKHRVLLEEFHSEISNKRTIAEFYSDTTDILESFKQEGKLDTQPKVDEYIKLLCLLCNTSSPKDRNILTDVLIIFSTIGESLASSEGLSGGDSANIAADALRPFVKRKLKRQQVFPTNKLVWVSLEDKPMIPDNREWEKMFSDKEGVHFLDMEDKSVRTPRSKGGNMLRGQKNKAIESRVKPEMINLVIEVCGIQKLSDAVDVRPTPDMVSPCLQLQDYFNQITPALQQYLVARFEHVYQSLEQMNMKDILANARFYQAGKLEVSYWIPSMSVDTFVIQPEKCVINPPEFYFHKDHLASLGDIVSKEVARFFSRGNTDCHNLLRSFLSELFNIISGVSDETVDGLLQRHDADDTDIPDEEKWKVEAPVLPEPDKPKELEAENNDTDTEPVAETTNQKEEPFEIRAWPPVANPEKPHARSTSEIPTSNVWPPPAAKDYMRSVKDLPANIKLVEAGDDSKQSTPCQQSNESDTKRIDVLTDQVVKPKQDVNGPYVHSTPHVHNTVYVQSEVKSENLTKTACDQTKEIKKTENIEVQQAHQILQAASTSKGEHNESQTPDNISVDDARSVDDVQNKSVDDMAGSPEKRKDKYRHYGTQWEEDDSPYRERKSIITGEPLWSNLATDYEYEDLGSGKDLGIVESIALKNEADGREIGYWGEALCSQYLQRQKELGNIKDYVWKNREEEARCPFDFEVKVASGKGSQTIFVEVKSTASEHKEAFEMSLQQVKFASRLKDSFHIYRVFNAGNPERVKLIRIKNLQKWLSTKHVKLCIVI